MCYIWWVLYVSWHLVIVPSWVPNFLVGISWVPFFFSCEYFECFSWMFQGSKIFLVGISWVQFFFAWIFWGFKIFSLGYYVGPFKCPPSAQLTKCHQSAESSKSLKELKAGIDIIFNGKHSSEMRFKQIVIEL